LTVSTLASTITCAATGASSYSFPFIAVSASDISVVYTTTAGAESTLSPTAYTVTLNSVLTGQIWPAGGIVSPVTPANYSSGTLTISRVLPLTQEREISNQGNQYPIVTEEALDTLCMEIQQVAARGGAYRGVWATGVVYNFGDIVQDGVNGAFTNNIYVCTNANTSGTWATDLANGDWALALNVQSLIVSGSYLPLSGGTVSGNLTVQGTTTTAAINASGTITGNVVGNVTGNVTGGTVQASALNGGQLAGLRNRIINGDMRIAQRGTSLSTPSSGAYNLDRWVAFWTGAAPATIAQVSGISGFQNALQITGAASNTLVSLQQRIESANVSDLVGQTVTISAALQASSAQTVAWSLAYPSAQDNFSSTTNIASGTWSVGTSAGSFSATVANLPSGAANGLMLVIQPANGGAFTSGTLTITGVQLENGSIATPFEHRPIGVSLALCQRYYIYSNYGGAQTYSTAIDGYATGSGGIDIGSIFYPVAMRVSPTVAFPAAAYTNASSITGGSSVYSPLSFDVAVTGSGSGRVGVDFTYTASAEL